MLLQTDNMFYLNQNNEIKSPQRHGLFLSQSTLMIIHFNMFSHYVKNAREHCVHATDPSGWRFSTTHVMKYLHFN